MSPKAKCPRCNKKRLFHQDEMKGVKRGEIVCVDCTLEEGYYLFLGEVLSGEHKELIAELQAQLEEDEA